MVRQYQMIQRTQQNIEARLVADTPLSAEHESRLRTVLQNAIERNEQIFPWTGDSHFMPRGYSLLAAEVNQSLGRLGWY
jgi:hypothetical protein